MFPKLVLHACCAPDEAYVVHLLKESRELYCYFSNPNIQPQEEYDRRRDEAQRVADRFSVPFVSPPYEPHVWEEAIRGLENTPEGGARCSTCFLLRLRQTAQFTRQIGWPSFASVMSISPHKNTDMLDEAGRQAAREYDVTYESFNFKKQDGFRKSIALSNELGLYRQDYCGCRLSKAERDIRRRKKLIDTQ